MLHKNDDKKALHDTYFIFFIISLLVLIGILVGLIVLFVYIIKNIEDKGGFLGGLFGGIATLIAFLVTAIINRKQYKEVANRNKELEKIMYQPYIELNRIDEEEVKELKNLGYLKFDGMNINRNQNHENPDEIVNLLIENCGHAVAYNIGLKIEIKGLNNAYESTPFNNIIKQSIFLGRGFIFPIHFYNLSTIDMIVINVYYKDVLKEDMPESNIWFLKDEVNNCWNVHFDK